MNRLSPQPDKLASPPPSLAQQLLPPPLADRLAAQLDRLSALLASLLGSLLARLPAPPRLVPSTALVDAVPRLCVLALLAIVSAVAMRRFFGLGGASAGSTTSSAGHGAELQKQPWTGRLAGNNAADPHRPEDVLTIKHGSSEFLFKYPAHTIASHALTLGHVRHKCAQLAGTADTRPVALLCAGHRLDPAHDAATLQSLGVEHGARILVISPSAPTSSASSAPQHEPAKPGPAKPTEPVSAKPARSGPAETIEAVRSRVAVDLLPAVQAFIDGSGNNRAETHRRLSETIMGELLKLDGVETDDPQLRARRKAVVRQIQGVLDSLDRSLREHR